MADEIRVYRCPYIFTSRCGAHDTVNVLCQLGPLKRRGKGDSICYISVDRDVPGALVGLGALLKELVVDPSTLTDTTRGVSITVSREFLEDLHDQRKDDMDDDT